MIVEWYSLSWLINFSFQQYDFIETTCIAEAKVGLGQNISTFWTWSRLCPQYQVLRIVTQTLGLVNLSFVQMVILLFLHRVILVGNVFYTFYYYYMVLVLKLKPELSLWDSLITTWVSIQLWGVRTPLSPCEIRFGLFFPVCVPCQSSRPFVCLSSCVEYQHPLICCTTHCNSGQTREAKSFYSLCLSHRSSVCSNCFSCVCSRRKSLPLSISPGLSLSHWGKNTVIFVLVQLVAFDV